MKKQFNKEKLSIYIENLQDGEPISLKLAKFLKKIGYRDKCEFFYQDIDLPFVPRGRYKEKNDGILNHNKYDSFIYSAPRKEQVAAWLTKKKML